MSKKLLVVPALLKAHVDTYTRKDGTVVQAHDDKRQAAKPFPDNHDFHAHLGAMKDGDTHHFGNSKFSAERFSVQKKGDKFHVGGPAAMMFKQPEGGHTHEEMASKLAGLHGKGSGPFASERLVDHGPEPKKPAAAADPRMLLPKAGGKPSTPEAVKAHAQAAGAKFKTNVSVFSKPDLAHSFAEKTKGAKGGAFVMKHPDHDHHVVVGGADAQRMEKNGYQHVKPGAAAPAKTGSAAPAKKVNVGSEKWPLHAKSSEKLPAKHADGSTHHVGGFKPPEYPEGGGSTDGDVLLHHEGKTFSFTGKKGKRVATGEDAYEYSHNDGEAEHRAWVTRSGHLMND